MEEKDFTINRKNVLISDFDTVYCNLLKEILNQGERFENRTGIDTFSIPNKSFTLNLSKVFPILESKKVAVKNAITEMLWIYKAQSNDVRWLQERGNHIWDEWEIGEDGFWRSSQNVPDGKGNYKKEYYEKNFGKEYAHTIGEAYGYITNLYKRPQYVLNSLKFNPHDRRMVISLWQDNHMNNAVLPSCVWSSEWKVYKDTLNAFIHQRSADVPLGLPFNVTQYAVLLSMFAKVSGYKPGLLSWSIVDAHIYENQVDGINEQLENYKQMVEYQDMILKNDDRYVFMKYKELSDKIEFLKKTVNFEKEISVLEKKLTILDLMITKQTPQLYLSNKDNFFEFDDQKDNEDIKVLKYKSCPKISMPISV